MDSSMLVDFLSSTALKFLPDIVGACIAIGLILMFLVLFRDTVLERLYSDS